MYWQPLLVVAWFCHTLLFPMPGHAEATGLGSSRPAGHLEGMAHFGI